MNLFDTEQSDSVQECMATLRFCMLSCYHSCRIFSCTREKFCSSVATRAECFSQDKILLFCYHNCRMFLTREMFSLLLPKLQNVSPQRNTLFLCYHNCSPQRKILVSCYHSCRMFLTREIFCCSATTIAEFSRECYTELVTLNNHYCEN